MQRRGVFINPATHNLQLKNQLGPQLAGSVFGNGMENKMRSGSARACVQEFVYPALQGLSSIFTSVEAEPDPGASLARQEFCPVENLVCGRDRPLQTPQRNFHKPDAN
jgi:hypothetical protein